MKQKLLYLFTRTPLHVGAGASLGVIDQPVQRERHTGFPIIPGSTVKGVFAEQWAPPLEPDSGSSPRQRQGEALWLFGGDGPASSAAGALQFSEAKLLAFPVRSAKGSFAWITSSLILRRLARDGGLPGFQPDGKPNLDYLPGLSLRDDQALFDGAMLAFGDKVVLEEYTLTRPREGGREVLLPPKLAEELGNILPPDPVWREVREHLVIVSDGLMSFFTQAACEVISHVMIDDLRGVTQSGTLYSQENVPSETMFYATVSWFADRNLNRPKDQTRQAIELLAAKLSDSGNVLQLGGDASTGLGICTLELKDAR